MPATNGSDPVAPGGGHNSQAGAEFAVPAADEREAPPEEPPDEVALDPPVVAEVAERAPPPVRELVAPDWVTAGLPVPPVVVVADVVEVVTVGAAEVALVLAGPDWFVTAVPAAPEVVAAVCAAAGIDKTANSSSAKQAESGRIAVRG